VDAGGAVSSGGKAIRGSGSYVVAPPGPTEALGAYRLLGGAGYSPAGSSLPAFASPPPTALSPATYNRSERTAQVRVAYGSGMSEWCANCHGPIHTPSAPGGAGRFQHPSGLSAPLGPEVTAIYNSYIRTGDLSGTSATSYSSLVPYEEGTLDRALLSTRVREDGSARAGPSSGMENVSCLSCHRAHASGWDHGLRWNAYGEFLVIDGQWPGTDAPGVASRPELAQGRTVAETRGAMYERLAADFATGQTSLCNKCHAK
jgi:hypothetical protein